MKKVIHGIVDHSTKTIIPENLDHWNMAIGDFQSGDRVTVSIENFVRPVTLDQMGLAHKYIAVIADEVGHTKQEMKKILKVKFGPRNEDGTIKSVSLYSVVEMGKFIDSLYLFGTEDLGLIMPVKKDLEKFNIK